MKLEFDLNNIVVTEFGIGRDRGDKPHYSAIVVDASVQKALCDMAKDTWGKLRHLADEPPIYEPSEKYGSLEYVTIPVSNDLSVRVNDLHTATNLPIDNKALAEPDDIFCYFARMSDSTGRHLTALRRATQFKGVVSGRLLRFDSDALKLIDDTVFKLDRDFDLLIDPVNVHILRPSGFEFLGELKDAILASVSQNLSAIRMDLRFVDFDRVEAYAKSRPRAARYLASIRSLKQSENINAEALKTLCRNTGVQLEESNGLISIPDGHIMGFLEVLDRRRYELELVEGTPESFRADSRRKLRGS